VTVNFPSHLEQHASTKFILCLRHLSPPCPNFEVHPTHPNTSTSVCVRVCSTRTALAFWDHVVATQQFVHTLLFVTFCPQTMEENSSILETPSHFLDVNFFGVSSFQKQLAWLSSLRTPLHTSLQTLTSQICCVGMIYTDHSTNISFLQIYL